MEWDKRTCSICHRPRFAVDLDLAMIEDSQGVKYIGQFCKDTPRCQAHYKLTERYRKEMQKKIVTRFELMDI